jgi:4-phytase/acid phosphatase
MCVLTGGHYAAQSVKTAVAGSRGGDNLKLVVILSRHGTRSSTWPQERLDSYSAQPWPKWSVPTGYLTSRGYDQMKLFGSFDRASLAEAGLFAAHGCEDASMLYIWADTDQRTMASGNAFAEGFFPGCPPEVHTVAADERDPLFHSTSAGMKPAATNAASTQLPKRAATQIDPMQRELIEEMQHVLLGCAPKISCTPVRAPTLTLLGANVAAVRGTDGSMFKAQDPLALASSFAEDMLLQYADGMPMDQVGWGKVDEAQLRRFLALHTENFEQTHRTPVQARLQASNMLLHITHTLQQAVEQQPVPDAFGPPNTKLILIAGHDSNIAEVAALLEIHWSLDGRTDDTPPGTELAFELWQDEHGTYSVRVTVAMQTLRQLREMQDLRLATPPAHATLSVRGCNLREGGCPWAGFLRIAGHAMDRSDVSAAGAK